MNKSRSKPFVASLAKIKSFYSLKLTKNTQKRQKQENRTSEAGTEAELSRYNN